MRILLCHNFYGSAAPSGENLVFVNERALLRRHGNEVAELTRHSDGLRRMGLIGSVIGALATPWNPFARWSVRRSIAVHDPDLVHVHNTFPLLSPALFGAIPRTVTRVITLHNYRLFCPAAIPLRAGRPCTECLLGSVAPALRHGCYRGSRLATAPLAASVALHRLIGTWERGVDAFIALTEFQRDLVVKAGLPSDRVWVKPNFVPGSIERLRWSDRDDRVVLVGRLSEEKGVADALRAWAAWGRSAPELRVIGDGPLRGELERMAAQLPRVRLLGQLSSEQANCEIGAARLLLIPSICFEGFPMVLAQALALGTPAAVSRIGPLPEIVRHGRCGALFAPGDSDALLDAVRKVWGTPELERMSEAARCEYEQFYSESANYAALLDIYRRAHERRWEVASGGVDRRARI